MRELTQSEIVKRGCRYCADKQRVLGDRQISQCPHEECPYRELDSVKTYGEYIHKTNESGLARALAELASK